MKPKEFYETMVKFVEEDKRWRALQVGDIIYDEQIRGIMDIDYHEMRIETIDVDERKVEAHDTTNPNYTRTLTHFLTKEEFEKL